MTGAVGGGTVLERAFAEAIATQGVVAGTAAYVRSMVQFDRARGWTPADVTRILFPEGEIRAQAAKPGLRAVVSGGRGPVRHLPRPGANEALAKLTAAGVKTCLVSSLSRPAASLLVERPDWWQRADLALSASDDGGRLRRAGATHLLADISELPDLFVAAASHHGE